LTVLIEASQNCRRMRRESPISPAHLMYLAWPLQQLQLEPLEERIVNRLAYLYRILREQVAVVRFYFPSAIYGKTCYLCYFPSLCRSRHFHYGRCENCN